VTTPLPEAVRHALDRPELALLWQRIRKQLERTDAQPRGTVRIPIPDHRTASELGAILGRRLTGHIGKNTQVDLGKLDQILRAGPAQLGLPDVIVALTGEQLLQKQVQRTTRTADNQQVWQELLDLMDGVPQMASERALLAKSPVGPVQHPPDDTAAGTTSWQVYEPAIRAACIWWRAHNDGRRMAARQLAGLAFRDTKKWTDQRRVAFANLAQRPFDQAVDEADIPIKLSGPLVWKFQDTIAHAATARPWIGLPAQGIRTLGYIECDAKGILVVENMEAFEKVCLLDGITERWLCVWNQGNPSRRLMRFLADLNLMVAAWCDLDAYGIRMIANLEKGLGRSVAPVGMSLALWRSGTKLLQTDQQLAWARDVAANFSTTGPVSLRELAVAITETGDCCEQETLYEQVLPTLDATLQALEQTARELEESAAAPHPHGGNQIAENRVIVG
jgi:hypothetical protein